MAPKREMPSRRSIIIVATIISIIIYALGVFSGLYANKIIDKKVQEDLGFLKSYIDVYSLDLKNMLIMQSLSEQIEDKCLFSSLYLDKLREQLEPFWQKLPARLESYDREGEKSAEYDTLKREYIRLSLRIWLIAKQNYEHCSSDLVPILYFYDSTCKTCIRQGEIFDALKDE